MLRVLQSLIALLFLILIGSCGTSKDRQYFMGLEDGMIIDSVFMKENVIRKGDQLAITVASLNPKFDALINKTNNLEQGYFVSEKGFVFLPRVGNVKVLGMTHAELIDTLTTQYEKYTKSPVISVRLMNFQIMVLGEVRRKGILKFQTPNVDIYQAIAMAGDITTYGKRSNVMIIRQTDSSRIVRRVDLSDPNIIGSDLYQLQSGDLIFVEANSAKRSQNSLAWQFIPIITSGMSFVVAIYGIFRSF